MQNQPDSRFNDYIDLVDNQGKLIGFTLQGNGHKFIFDKNGGWFDQFGKYYNSDAILSQPNLQQNYSSDDQNQNQQKQNQENFHSTSKNKLANQKNQAIRNLHQIINAYSKQDIIPIQATTRPQLDDEQVQMYFQSKGIKIQCNWNKIEANKQKSFQIIQFEGVKIKDSILYLDIPLKDGVRVNVLQQMDIDQLQSFLTNQSFEKGLDFGNCDISQTGITMEINKNLQEKIKEKIKIQIIQ